MATRKTVADPFDTDVKSKATTVEDPVSVHLTKAKELLAEVPNALGDHGKLLLINEAGVHAHIAQTEAIRKWYESSG
jgi:hypothetical protein